MKKALFIICAMAAMKVELYACLGCSRLEVLESSVPLRVSDDGVFRGNITTMNFTGDLQVTRVGNTAIVTYSTPSGSGGGDNLGSHKATQTVDMAGFAIANASGATITGNMVVSSFNAANFTTTNTAKVPSITFGDGTVQNTAVGGGDNFGSHKATKTVDMGGFSIANTSGISNSGSYTGANMTVTSFTASHVTATGTYNGNAVYLDNTVGAANAGAPVGFGRAFNFTGSAVGNVTQSGATFTVTLNDTTGGGGSSIRPYRIVVGTLTAADVDIASDTVDGLNEALRRLGAAGLTDSTTAVGFIFYKEGLYRITGATIPAGITVFSAIGSSTVWSVNVTTHQMAVIYGKIDGLTFDIAVANYTTDMLVFKNNSQLRNFKIEGGKNLDPNVERSSIFSIKNTSNVVIQNGDLGIMANGADQIELGQGSSIEIYFSSHIVLDNLYIKEHIPSGGSQTNGVIGISTSTDVTVKRLFVERSGDIFLGIHGAKEIYIEDNSFFITKTGDARGYLGIWDDGVASSTGVIFNRNKFVVTNQNSGKLIAIGQCDDGAQGFKVNGVVISNNFVTGGVAGWTFVKTCNADAINTVLLGNNVFNANTFITDSGVGTKYTGNDNFFNGVEQ